MTPSQYNTEYIKLIYLRKEILFKHFNKELKSMRSDSKRTGISEQLSGKRNTRK
jgi:hypothetical protein